MFRAEADIEIGKYTAKLSEMEARARQSSQRIASGTRGTSEGVSRRMLGSAGLGSSLLGNLGGAISLYKAGQLAIGAFNVAVERESLVAGLAATSHEDVNDQLERLRDLGRKPGLGTDQVIQGSTRLQAVGLSAQQAEGMLEQFGNALALVGKGKDDLDGVILAFTQIAAKGKVMSQEINQIAERVPQIRGLMQQAFGTADTETIQKLGLSATEFFDRITEAAKGLPRAMGTTSEQISNLGDEWRNFQEELVGFVGVAGTVSGALDWLTKHLEKNVEAFQFWQQQWDESKRPDWMLLDGSTAADFPDANPKKTYTTGLLPGGADVIYRKAESDDAKKAREAAEKKAKDAASLTGDLSMNRLGQLDGAEKVAAATTELERVLGETVGKFPFFEKSIAGLDQLARKRLDKGDVEGAKEALGWLKDAQKLNEIIQESAKRTQDELKSLREQADRGAFDLMSPKEQAAALRDRVGKSLGIDIQGAADVQRGLQQLRDQVQEARQKGDAEAEKAALEKLGQAQEDAKGLAGLDRGAGSGGGYQGIGEAGRTFNLLFGRSGYDAGLSESKTQTTLFRSMEKLLKEIRDKAPPDTDVFTDF